MADPGFRIGTHSPMVSGGVAVPEAIASQKPSIFRKEGNYGHPRVHLPKLNPKYPETKHTVKCGPPTRAQSSRMRLRHMVP